MRGYLVLIVKNSFFYTETLQTCLIPIFRVFKSLIFKELLCFLKQFLKN